MLIFNRYSRLSPKHRCFGVGAALTGCDLFDYFVLYLRGLRFFSVSFFHVHLITLFASFYTFPLAFLLLLRAPGQAKINKNRPKNKRVWVCVFTQLI
uniref:Uncharacterized protein n=1 Tax=Anopheles coluzzii TaxID=1518534 RepID=A0A6E8V890_ANOCL